MATFRKDKAFGYSHSIMAKGRSCDLFRYLSLYETTDRYINTHAHATNWLGKALSFVAFHFYLISMFSAAPQAYVQWPSQYTSQNQPQYVTEASWWPWTACLWLAGNALRASWTGFSAVISTKDGGNPVDYCLRNEISTGWFKFIPARSVFYKFFFHGLLLIRKWWGIFLTECRTIFMELTKRVIKSL